MAVLYVALGIILGAISGIIFMAMFFVAKRTDEQRAQMSTEVACAAYHKNIISS